VPDFNTVIPNRCEAGEPSYKPVNTRYTQFDDLLAREVPTVESSPAFGRDGVIIITDDEDQQPGRLASQNGLGAGGHVACAVLSPSPRPGQRTRSTTTTASCARSKTAMSSPITSATQTT